MITFTPSSGPLTPAARRVYAKPAPAKSGARVCQPGIVVAQAASFERGFFFARSTAICAGSSFGMSRPSTTGPGRPAQVATLSLPGKRGDVFNFSRGESL